ncbi:MAG: helix-hairpin-helix domain-containing protein [Candidatus Thorarchaeota archaeon]|nr:helix-hairpin-helix domain-containing protein [Candidatus Thorarchaeota archaeon]
MLQYREFPIKTTIIFLLFAAPFAFCIFIITNLISGTLFELTLLEHHGLLGYGALAGVFTLPLSGIVADRVKRLDPLIILVSIIPASLGLTKLTTLSLDMVESIDFVLVIASFACLSSLLVFWTIRVNQSIIVRYRGRSTALFLALAVILSAVYAILPQINLTINSSILIVPALIAMISVFITVGLRPWKQPRVSLAASGTVIRYFIPTVLIMASYLLWYMVTKLAIQQGFFGDPSYVSLPQLVNLQYLEYALLIIGILCAGFISDIRGRKPAFSFSLLLMGLLTIFGSALYNAYFLDPDLTILLISLLGSERFIEGYLLGLYLLLIWPELGSVKSKGLRLSLVWFFFLGFMALYWAVDLNSLVFGIQFHIPSVVYAVGGQFAILFSLIALYLIGPLPTILGREIEIEELALDFDERQVKKTVDAFVGADDFASIKSQLDIIDAGSEISDSDMSEILGVELKDSLPLRSVPGIGEALEKKLHSAGYDSAAQLAGETAQRLAQKIDGLTIARAEKILKDARKVVQKTIKKGNSKKA